MSKLQPVNPPEWKKPIGYSNAILSHRNHTLWIGGQVAFDANAQVIGKGDLLVQFGQVCKNLSTVIETAGGTLQDIVTMTIFVQDRDDYRARAREIGRVYREHFGDHYPAMSLVEIARFYEDDVLIEIEAVAQIQV